MTATKSPVCAECAAPATQRIVTDRLVRHRCDKHSWSKARAKLHDARLFSLDPKNPVVLSPLRPDCDDATSTHRTPRGDRQTRRTTMAATKEATKTPTAPKPGRGFTVVELRTPHQSEIVKASTKGLPAGSIKFEDRWVVVKNENAQAVVDKVIGNAGAVGIFDRRVLDFFVAVILLSNDKLTDSRQSLHSRLIQVGRGTPDFRFEMKQDGTLLVHAKGKALGTQKDAMKALDASQLKAPVRTGTGGSGGSGKASIHDDYAAAKAERKALKEWEAADEATRGPRPSTDTYDAMQAEYERKEAAKVKAAEERKADEAKTPAKKAAGTRQVEPRLKGATTRRKAS